MFEGSPLFQLYGYQKSPADVTPDLNMRVGICQFTLKKQILLRS